MSILNDRDEKLTVIAEYPILNVLRKYHELIMKEIERASFASINSSFMWIGTTISQIRSLYASHL